MFADIVQVPAVQSLARRLEPGGVLSGVNVSAAAQPFFAVLLQKIFPGRPMVVVTGNLKAQESFQQDLETWLTELRRAEGEVRHDQSSQTPDPRPQTHFYPAWETLPHENRLPHADTISDRLQTLLALASNSKSENRNPKLVVVSVAALLQKTFAPAELKSRVRTLQRGDRAEPLDLVEWLEAQGYEPEAQVTQKGEIALRGGILDIFPPTSPWPVRLEFFGDELESLRSFDPLTQISREEIAGVTLPPAGELGILKDALERGLQPASTQEAGSVATASAVGTTLKRPEGRAPLATLLDYLPPETVFLLCEPEELAVRAEEYAAQIPVADPFYFSWAQFRAELGGRGMTQLELREGEAVGSSSFSGSEPIEGATATLAMRAPVFSSLDAFRPLGERVADPQVAEVQRKEFFGQIHRWLRQGYAVHVFCNNDGERQRFEEIWNEMVVALSLRLDKSAHRADATPRIQIGSLARGFLCDEAKLVVVSDAEIFGRYKIQRPRRLRSSHAAAMRSALEIDFADLEEGDLVVHLQHGIGRYLGLKNSPDGPGNRQSAIGNRQSEECLVIEFAPTDEANEPPKLYVPVSESHLISKYVGAGKLRPPLNTLTGTRWRKAVEQTETAVRDVAAEMLRIQAVRESQAGYACKPDAPWQREFESAFIYEETPDQLTAIADTKADMERPKPMDRLICGDVGFGKTEVAIRAAFKAVMDGKQAAILVPTTVLAQQHFNNFRERMADYPVRVELLSRYRTRREQERVVKDLAAGAVDIVIGTHRLVQSDIAFKDLGLVVIDEEQRFGVQHKEKFKRLRTLVDVLTLSATPIPRTLYLALTGARDMSTIQTPPHDRLPVETTVIEYDERVIRDAIQREINRGGQVFFLHNRVLTIHTMQQKLQSLLPNARILVGHGQMNSDDLEDVMTKFIAGEADVLLSTTIIESGLDIPNANTIIIDRADRFGLSDLYQLRGRVGRYKHQAYAYLMLPRHARMLTEVRKRISAMKQYSTLGSGFKIAMRDLEIRGAGNLLGSEQSGHITAVGFELYCQLLKQSVASMKGETVKPRVEVKVHLDFLELQSVKREGTTSEPASRFTPHASLPPNYVPEAQHRIEFYRKLAQATDKPALEGLQNELRDRFGPLPPAVELLLGVAELKIMASEKAVTIIEVKDDKLMLTRRGELFTPGGKFPRLTKKDAKARVREIKKALLAL